MRVWVTYMIVDPSDAVVKSTFPEVVALEKSLTPTVLDITVGLGLDTLSWVVIAPLVDELCATMDADEDCGTGVRDTDATLELDTPGDEDCEGERLERATETVDLAEVRNQP